MGFCRPGRSVTTVTPMWATIASVSRSRPQGPEQAAGGVGATPVHVREWPAGPTPREVFLSQSLPLPSVPFLGKPTLQLLKVAVPGLSYSPGSAVGAEAASGHSPASGPCHSSSFGAREAVGRQALAPPTSSLPGSKTTRLREWGMERQLQLTALLYWPVKWALCCQLLRSAEVQ